MYLDFDLIRYPNTSDLLPIVQGEGRSGLLIIIEAGTDTAAAEIDYLEKIAQAVQLAPIDKQLFRLAVSLDTTFNASQLARHLGVERIIFFGVPPVKAGIKARLPQYDWQRISTLRILWADAIQTIRQEREAGKKEKALALWNALQVLTQE